MDGPSSHSAPRHRYLHSEMTFFSALPVTVTRQHLLRRHHCDHLNKLPRRSCQNEDGVQRSFFALPLELSVSGSAGTTPEETDLIYMSQFHKISH